MKKLILLVLVFAGFMACENEVIAPEITEIEADQGIGISARTGGVSVCHKNAGEIVIGDAALETHIAHGDAVDMDGDGYFDIENDCTEGIDCDDTNAEVNPGVEEICDNGLDDNCDGEIDEGCVVECLDACFSYPSYCNALDEYIVTGSCYIYDGVNYYIVRSNGNILFAWRSQLSDDCFIYAESRILESAIPECVF